MISYLLLGAAIGALTGVPIGPVNVAVIDSAYRHNVRRAIAVGVGGAVADSAYAWVGILGVGPVLEANPGVPPILYAISGVVLTVYGLLTMRTRQISISESTPKQQNTSGYWWGGFAVGVLLILMNPAAIVTWVVIVGSFMAGVTSEQGVAASLGVGMGSAMWFVFVAYLADHGKKVLGGKAVYITRIVGVLLVVYGLYSLGRAGYYAWQNWL